VIEKRESLRIINGTNPGGQRLSSIVFITIIFLGCINVLLMGYLPVMDTSRNYHEFGVAVLDPLFNTLSIFFSVFFFHLFLKTRNLRYTGFVILILLFQVLIFRRSTIVWILTSVTFCYLLYNPTIKLKLLLALIIILPIVSYSFGIYGNIRSNLTKSFVLDELAASKYFKESGINHEHYMTYLYISSPLANLQKNVNEGTGFINNGEFRDFLFYCIIPQSITLRLQKSLKLSEPECFLISGNLIVGTLYMVGFYTFGWIGLILISLFLVCIIFISIYIIRKWDTFNITAYAILLTTISLLIFSNFLNRLDVLLMLFIYPPLFHLIYVNNKIIRFLEPSGRVTTHNNFSD
jgi:hypothetical protein